MAWKAFEHLRIGWLAVSDNPAIIGVDPDRAAASLCGLAAIGPMIGPVRAAVSGSIVLGITYMRSARHVAGTLGVDALTYRPVQSAAVYVCWPQLNRVES
jgi:hypothetical protein